MVARRKVRTALLHPPLLPIIDDHELVAVQWVVSPNAWIDCNRSIWVCCLHRSRLLHKKPATVVIDFKATLPRRYECRTRESVLNSRMSEKDTFNPFFPDQQYSRNDEADHVIEC